MTTQYMASDERLANRIREQLTFLKKLLLRRKCLVGFAFCMKEK